MKKTDCGFEYETRTQLWRHRRTCCLCASSAKSGAPTKPGGWRARCGAEVSTKASLRNHQKSCPQCLEIKTKNIKERQVRVNQGETHRQASSEAAKLTSLRPEIIKQRSEALANWRKNNPDKFAKCTEAAQAASKTRSRAEVWLSQHLGWPQVQISCGETKKQVDLVFNNVWIEVDGFWHFYETKRTKDIRPSRIKQTLAYRQSRDVILNNEALRRGNVTLLRFSSDCFKRNGEMRQEWLSFLTAMLLSPQPGIWCLGKLYELAPWAKNGCMTLRSPTPNTIFSSPAGL